MDGLAHNNRGRGRVVFIGFLLIIGVAFWYGGKLWYDRYQEKEEEAAIKEQTVSDTALTDLRFLTPKEVLARRERQEDMLFVDIRSKEEFDTEHVVDAVSVPVTLLNTFSAHSGQLVIVVSGPAIPNQTLKGIHELFTERKYTFAFLQGSIVDWKLAGGTTISSGDPASLFDYSKVIFINPDQVPTIAQELSTVFFLDVREESAFEKEHLPGAINIPLSDLERRRSDIPKGASIFVYGENDYESYQGGVRLFDLNFFGARVIRGGFTAWKEKGLPTLALEQQKTAK